MNALTTISLGTVIVVRGLANATDLNGRFGTVVGLQGTRLLVDIEGTGVVKAIKQENCKLPRPVRAYCHSCRTTSVSVFAPTGELKCPGCDGTFVEAVPTNAQLREASAFTRRRETQQPTGPTPPAENDTAARLFGSLFAPPPVFFFAPTPGGLSGQGAPSFEDFLNMLHQQSEPRGAPPASREAVETLEQFTSTRAHAEHDCSVCQDAYAEGEKVTKMPCGHLFHSDCIAPWLKEHNSCPTCRHELPTDDADYEARKRAEQQQGAAAGQQHAMDVETAPRASIQQQTASQEQAMGIDAAARRN